VGDEDFNKNNINNRKHIRNIRKNKVDPIDSKVNKSKPDVLAGSASQNNYPASIDQTITTDVRTEDQSLHINEIT